MKAKGIGSRKPRAPEKVRAPEATLERPTKALDPKRPRGVFKFRTWTDLEEWENNRRIEETQRMRLQ